MNIVILSDTISGVTSRYVYINVQLQPVPKRMSSENFNVGPLTGRVREINMLIAALPSFSTQEASENITSITGRLHYVNKLADDSQQSAQ